MSFLSSILNPGNPNEQLRELMSELAKNPSPSLESVFFHRLRESSLSIASPSLQSQGLKIGEQTAGEELSVRFIASTDPQGRPAMLAFTGNKAVLVWRPAGCDIIEMKFPDLCRLALASKVETILIDWGSPNASLIEPHNVAAFAEGKVPMAAGEVRAESLTGEIVFSPVPQQPPQFLCDALREQAKEQPAILAILLVAGAFNGQPSVPLIALEIAADADPDLVIPKFAEGTVVRLGGRPIPDILPLIEETRRREARGVGLLVCESSATR